MINIQPSAKSKTHTVHTVIKYTKITTSFFLHKISETQLFDSIRFKVDVRAAYTQSVQ